MSNMWFAVISSEQVGGWLHYLQKYLNCSVTQIVISKYERKLHLFVENYMNTACPVSYCSDEQS